MLIEKTGRFKSENVSVNIRYLIMVNTIMAPSVLSSRFNVLKFLLNFTIQCCTRQPHGPETCSLIKPAITA